MPLTARSHDCQGIDRHLLGLRLLCALNGVSSPLFEDELLERRRSSLEIKHKWAKRQVVV